MKIIVFGNNAISALKIAAESLKGFGKSIYDVLKAANQLQKELNGVPVLSCQKTEDKLGAGFIEPKNFTLNQMEVIMNQQHIWGRGTGKSCFMDPKDFALHQLEIILSQQQQEEMRQAFAQEAHKLVLMLEKDLCCKIVDDFDNQKPSKHIAFALDPKLPNKPFITQGKSNARNGLPFPRNPPY